MLRLTTQIMHRLYHMDRKHLSIAVLQDKLHVLGRMTAAYARGEYRYVPLKTMLTILAGLIYFLNPLDLVPDAILGVGLMDDLAVLTWIYRSASGEVERFVAWDALFRQASTDLAQYDGA